MIWIILFVFMFICAFLEMIGKKFSIIVYMIFICALIFLATMRSYGYSYDLEVYYDLYNNTSTFGSVMESYIEPGYMLFGFLFRVIGLDFRIFLFVVISLSIGIKCYVFALYSDKKITALFLYYCIFYFYLELTQIRFGLALAIFILAFSKLKDKRIKLFYCLCAIAISIHYSVVVFLPIQIFMLLYHRINKNLYRVILVLLCMVMSMLNWFEVFAWINDLVLHSDNLNTKLSDYVIAERVIIPNVSLLYRGCFFVGILLVLNKFHKDKYREEVDLYIYGFIIYFIFLSIPILAERSINFVRFQECYIVPISLSEKCNYIDKLVFKVKNLEIDCWKLIPVFYACIKFMTIIMQDNYFNYTIL